MIAIKTTTCGIFNSFAMLVEAALGIDAELWIKMQTHYKMQTAIKDKTFAKRLEQIHKVAAEL